MFDPIPHSAHVRTDVYAECAARLGVTRDVFRRVAREAQRAGYRGTDAVATAYIALADPQYGIYAPGGRQSADPVLAAVYRHCPRRQREADRRLRCALSRRTQEAGA